jgi:hypothetical protein
MQRQSIQNHPNPAQTVSCPLFKAGSAVQSIILLLPLGILLLVGLINLVLVVVRD